VLRVLYDNGLLTIFVSCFDVKFSFFTYIVCGNKNNYYYNNKEQEQKDTKKIDLLMSFTFVGFCRLVAVSIRGMEVVWITRCYRIY